MDVFRIDLKKTLLDIFEQMWTYVLEHKIEGAIRKKRNQ